MSLYNPVVFLLKPFFWLFWRPKHVHRDRLPQNTSGIIICNHFEWWDPLLLAIVVPKNEMHFISKSSLFKNPLRGWLLKVLNAFPVDKSKPDIVAVKKCISVVKEGKLLCIFPEGTRSKTKELLPFEGGTAFIAIKCDCPIYPAHISKVRHHGKLVVTFGDPLDITNVGLDLKRNERMELINQMMRDAFLKLDAEQQQMP